MSAIISECEKYRYALTRSNSNPSDSQWSSIVFLMLNPSTADDVKPDPTVTRLKGFIDAWGVNGLIVVNLFAFRASKPKVMLAAHKEGIDIIGPKNDAFIRELCAFKNVVCAWGANAHAQDRVEHVLKLLDEVGAQTWCMGVNDDGSPKHPLYLKGDTQLQPYPAPVTSTDNPNSDLF